MAVTKAGFTRSQGNRDGAGVPYLYVGNQIQAPLLAALSTLAAPRYKPLAWDRTQPWRGALVLAKAEASMGGISGQQPGQPPGQSSGQPADPPPPASDPPGASIDPSLAACVLQTASDAVVLVCPRGRVRTWNRGAVEIFQVPASEAVGRDLTELITPPHIHHIRPLDPKPQYGRRHLRRAPAMRRDGSAFTAEFTVQPLSEEEGCAGCAGADGVVVVLRDASEMGETVRKLRMRVAELEAGMQKLVDLAKPRA
jgi:PAS domain S-box-containing protein